MRKWLKAVGRAIKPVAAWAAKIVINAGREKIEEIIDDKKGAKRAPTARPKIPNES